MKPGEPQSLRGLKIKENEQDMVNAYNRSTWEMKLGVGSSKKTILRYTAQLTWHLTFQENGVIFSKVQM